MDRHVILVFTEPAEGREEEYNAVYTAHVPEVVAVKGVVAGRRFRWSDPERTDGPPQPYLAIYELEGDLETVRAALVADGHPAQLPDSYGPANTDWWFTAISEPVRNPDAGSLSDRHVILVFTEPTEDREDEYNSFYSEIQVPEVVTTKGVVSGQRFRLGYAGRFGGPPHRYLAMYELEGDLDAMRAEFAADHSSRTPLSGAQIREHTAWWFTAISERVETTHAE